MRLHGFSEERGHFCNVISHHCFGAPRKGDAVSTPPPSASLIPCLFLVLRRSVFDSFLFLFAKVRHAASATVSKTQRGALLGNRRRRARAESQHGRKVSLGSSLRRSFLKILRRIERSAARTRICIQRLSVGGGKRPNWWNRYLVHGPDAAN